ncbi:MAG: hypothetical protein LBM92_00940 [Opitutaceae bacterium]|jgi:glycerophosphoryl diester phosphodiesterase|nr:hypothetical protein [Opitutaceae bacterium]
MNKLKALALAAIFSCATVLAQENGVTAHRGNSNEYPENSLAAFRSAAEMGADWIETDIQKTADGFLVICHDATTQKVAGSALVIKNSTMEQLRNLDMAHGFRKNKGLAEAECPRLPILTLEEVLSVILQSKSIKLSLHPKSDCVDQAMEIIRGHKALSRVGFNSGNQKFLARVKELEPGVPVFWDLVKCNDADMETAKQQGFETIVLRRDNVTLGQIAAAHAAGIKFGVWTVNDPAEMRKFLRMGVDRIYTDRPKVLLDIKK